MSRVSTRQLSVALNVSTRHVRRLAAAGMPVSSISAAKAWKAVNIMPKVRYAELDAEPWGHAAHAVELLEDEEADGHAVEQALGALGGALSRAGLSPERIAEVFDELVRAYEAALRTKGWTDEDVAEAASFTRATLDGD
jgi:hypothetical protein